ncbi:MAG: aminotransferase class I and II [Deltaproteobacteria bacterium]|nr:aminotransferase class I and II [Myxococcales bacterium]MDP3218010.1 aminotransferase class I and II [Deltaproteobacteria bacterium]
MLRTVHAIRYVMPFREGSSVPALVEADDLGLYVVKLRGAGQGHKALVAELITGGLARAVGLAVPEIVLVQVERALSASEPDPELSAPLEASAGINLGLDYLPGSVTFDPVASPRPDAATASRVVLFDALVTNVDRTPRNPNLLQWHGRPWLIDHGASLYFHHGWEPDDPLENSRDPFVEARSHVLLPWATALGEAAEHLRAAVTTEVIDAVVGDIPGEWLGEARGFPDEATHRAAYAAWLRARVEAMPLYLEEAERAHARRV